MSQGQRGGGGQGRSDLARHTTYQPYKQLRCDTWSPESPQTCKRTYTSKLNSAFQSRPCYKKLLERLSLIYRIPLFGHVPFYFLPLFLWLRVYWPDPMHYPQKGSATALEWALAMRLTGRGNGARRLMGENVHDDCHLVCTWWVQIILRRLMLSGCPLCTKTMCPWVLVWHDFLESKQQVLDTTMGLPSAGNSSLISEFGLRSGHPVKL